MTKKSAYELQKLKRKYVALRSREILLLTLAASCVVFGLASMINTSIALRLILSGGAGAAVFAITFFFLKLYRVNEHRLISFINRKYPVMQHSTDLLFRDSADLNALQQIQKQRIRGYFPEVLRTVTFPHQIDKAVITFGVSIALTLVMVVFFRINPSSTLPETGRISRQEENSGITLPAAVKGIAVKVNPPRYTGLASYSTNDLHLSIAEGSVVEWQISFTDIVQNPQLLLLPRDSVPLAGKALMFTTKRSFSGSTIYQFSWTTTSGKLAVSDYYKIQVIADRSPKIAIPQLSEYTDINANDKQSMKLRAELSDDYGLKDAYIIATVSKGSGESVKFREERFSFTSPAKIRGRRTTAACTIDFANLGMEPGDELYFYIEALDNKTPSANRSRSGTFFIALQDTASQMLSLEAGPGVDLMPAYFRSQRQIITDTENLLHEKKAINRLTFNARSNALGYDQKMLRLKYGEFLGEEFEQTVGPNNANPQEDDHHEGDEQDPIAAYKHIHDDPEEATFFTQSIKAKLKAALTAMWDAELHLRTFHPEKSLPHQYTALRLLKDISQASRIYVHKTGFDPPPLKEEKRLSGDRSEIKNSRYHRSIDPEETYPAIKSALRVLEESLDHPDSSLTPSAKHALLQAGQELAVLAIEEPGNYLNALSLIKSLNEDSIPPEQLANGLLMLRKVFWRALPEETVSPDKPVQSAHRLNRVFIENLESLKNE